MNYSIMQIKKSFNSKAVKDSFVVCHILRPISIYMTYLMLRANITTNQVTLLGLCIGLTGIGLFMTGSEVFFRMAVLCYLFYKVCDYTDGNVARVTDSATYYGKFLDGAVDGGIEGVLPFAIGWGYFIIHENSLLLFASVITSLFVFFSLFLINRLSFINRWIKIDEKQTISGQMKHLNPLKSSKIPVRKIGNLVTDVKILILFIALFTSMPGLLLSILLIMLIGFAIILIMITLQSAYKQTSIHRISRSDMRLKKKVF